MTNSAAVVKSAMRRDLSAALKERRADAVTALRTAIAVLDNAEAVDASAVPTDVTEVARRDLSPADVRAILTGHLDESLAEAQRYEQLGRHDAAQRLRRDAEIVRAYV
jgi:uncharacterized protein